MKKKWMCGLLSVCLLLSLLPGVPLRIRAAVNMKASEALIDVTKKMEGFSKYPYWDYSQWTVGYGTECPDDKLEEYKANGIPEDVAEALLYEEMIIFETEVNNFLNKYNLTVKQHQFDALVSLSYNCGGNWTRDTTGYLSLAVRSGDMGNGLIYAMSLYSKAHTDYVLIKRRLAEANMYINGIYKAYNYDSDAIPSTYKYVFLDGNGGTVHYAIHGYDAADPMTVVTSFSHIPGGVDEAGNAFLYEFAGWYTASVGGTRVDKLDGSLSNGAVLYAQWKNPQGEIVALPKGDPAENLQITVNSTINIRSGPGTYYPKIGSLTKGSVVTITETFTTNGTLWGKYDGGWISLSYTNYEEVLESTKTEPTWPREGTVTGSNVNVRSGPGTSNPMQYQLNTGDRVVISETYDDGNLLWGKLEDGNWICMSYVELDPEEGTEPAPVITGVELLKAPDRTEYVQMQDELDLIGSILQVHYSNGTVSAMTLTRSMVTSYSNAKLGQTTVKAAYKGYTVSFTVNIIKATVTFLNYDGTVLSSAQYAYGDKVVEPEIPVKPADAQGEYNFVGWDPMVTTCNGDATYTAVFELKPELYTVTFLNYDGTVLSQTQYELGAEVVVPEAPVRPADENGEYVFVGWDKEVTACQGDAVYTAVFELRVQEPDGTWPRYGTVTGDNVNVRTGPGTTYDKAEYQLNTGDRVVISQIVYDGSTYWWGKLEDGNWICMEYVALYVLGDFDGNEVVDEDDAIYLLRHVFFPEDYPVESHADFNGDGMIDEDDAIYLLRYVFFPEDYPLTGTGN